ncbi:MAG: polyprenyl synthetase family protein [Gaiellaceae bacterium]
MRSPDELRELVEGYLTELALAAELGELREAVSYSLLGGGKRIRPVLALASAQALGVDVERMLPGACSLELVHTFSLVHDDLPALDDDDLRRGQPSCHAKFGEAVAILAGDALLSEALRLALSYDTPQLAREVVDATLGMIGGQYIDITTEGALDAAGLVELHRLKTGKLLSAPIGCALALAEPPDGQRRLWRAFAADIGLLFQIVDDILDATGTAEELGKTPGKDEAAGKVTYVTLHGLERSRELADEVRARVEGQLNELDADTSALLEIVATIRERRA